MSLRKYYKVIDNREDLEIPNPKHSKPESCSTAAPLKRILMMVVLLAVKEATDCLQQRKIYLWQVAQVGKPVSLVLIGL